MSEESEKSTRQTVLNLIIEHGPVTASDIARSLELTPAAVRRHTAILAEEGQIVDRGPTSTVQPRRGRPARYFVATGAAHDDRTEAPADLASAALGFVRDLGGDDALRGFLHTRYADVESRYRARLEQLDAVHAPSERRVAVLAEVLSEDGFVATVRGFGEGSAVQLCQGHCPVRLIAQQHPELCEAETEAFGRMLGIHVQRLSTQAAGGHVCTTHIPLTAPKIRSNPVHLRRFETSNDPEGSR